MAVEWAERGSIGYMQLKLPAAFLRLRCLNMRKVQGLNFYQTYAMPKQAQQAYF